MLIHKLLSIVNNERILLSIRIKCFWLRHTSRFKKVVFFISTPSHGNLGDHAIVLAQYRLMEKIGAGRSVVEITRSRYEQNRDKLIRIVRPEDLIIIDGGGNIGTLWIQEEYKMRDIVRRFPQNPVFIFPQTAFFSNDENGALELEQSVLAYSSHKKLTVFCRDRYTRDLFRTRFPEVTSYFVPDIVLSLHPHFQKQERSKILFCIREDREKSIPDSILSSLSEALRAEGWPVEKTSTIVPRSIGKADRIRELNAKWAKFSQARLVVTDRLHGMIFCAITGTPCVALDNISHKVRNGYDWLKPLPYLQYCSDLGQLGTTIRTMLQSVYPSDYPEDCLEQEFRRIEDLLSAELCN